MKKGKSIWFLAYKNFILGLSFLFLTNASFAQDFQIGASLGPSANYLHEHQYTDVKYYNGLSFQVDFTFLDSNKFASYGFSVYSNSVESFDYIKGQYSYNGLVTNTGLVFSRYFEKMLSPKLMANWQIGAGLNHETIYYGNTRLMLNLVAGAELKYEVSEGWFFLLKGLAVLQDVPNIVRYYTFNRGMEAGEDLHFVSLLGIAANIGRK